MSGFARQNSREDGPYIQGTMTEVKSALKVAEVTIYEPGQLKKRSFSLLAKQGFPRY